MTIPNHYTSKNTEEWTAEPHPFQIFLKNRDEVDWKHFCQVLANASRDGVLAVSDTGVVLFANQFVQENFQLFSDDQIRQILPDLWLAIEKTLNAAERLITFPARKEEKGFSVKITPILWKEVSIGAICLFEDRTDLEEITRQMIAHQELNSELDAIISTSFDALWVCDETGRVIRINPASERINNVRADEVVGKRMDDLVANGFIDQSVTLEVIRRKSVVSIIQQTKDGRKLMNTGNPIFNKEGQLIRVVVNERDVTEIEDLYNKLEEQKAIQNQFRNHMLNMQLEELESKRVIAKSPCMVKALQQALKVASVESTVLLLGESGVGKGMIANLIRKYSARSGCPLIEINCGAIPESLVEAELFGYEKGAFTGAGPKGKAGYFELADDGILFLDEIGELPLSSQVKLLRFLEDGLVSRIGSTLKRKVNVRVLIATNRDLGEMVKEGKFRLDLFHRLNVIPIHIPPLRERQECILPLLQHYIDFFSVKLNITRRFRFSRRATEALLSYDFPGNIRELMNLCERLVVMTDSGHIDLDDLPGCFAPKGKSGEFLDESRTLSEMIGDLERKILRQALEKYGSQEKAAQALGVNQSTIARKLKKSKSQRT